MSRKAKFVSGKARGKSFVHLDYLRVYHEVLKYEEVLDTDLDEIFEAVMSNLQRKLGKGSLNELPDPIDIEIIIKEVMDKLTAANKAA